MCLLNRCLGRGDVLLLLIFLLRQGLRREVEVVYLLIDVSSESYIIPSSFLLLSKNSLDRSNWIFYFWYQNWEFSLKPKVYSIKANLRLGSTFAFSLRHRTESAQNLAQHQQSTVNSYKPFDRVERG